MIPMTQPTWAKIKGPPSRIRSASRSITAKSAPIAEARSVLFITYDKMQQLVLIDKQGMP